MPPGDNFKKVFTEYPSRKFRKNETVLRAGTNNATLHYLESGYVRSYLITEEGWILTINILSSGAIFPLTQVLADIKTNPYEFQALSKVSIKSAPAKVITDYLNKNPESLLPLTRKFASGIEGLVNRLKYLMKANGHKRVLSAFDLLVKKFGSENSDGSIRIKLSQTHQDIADIAGVTRETATRELQVLKKQGVIYNYKKITVVRNLKKFKRMLKSDDDPQTKYDL